MEEGGGEFWGTEASSRVKRSGFCGTFMRALRVSCTCPICEPGQRGEKGGRSMRTLRCDQEAVIKYAVKQRQF